LSRGGEPRFCGGHLEAAFVGRDLSRETASA
jgi:hypothetical protein